MLFVNKSKFRDLSYLYDISDMKILDVSVQPLDIKRLKNIEDVLFFIDPNIEDLKLALDLEKEIIVLFTFMHEDYLDIVRNSLVKKVLVVDDLDALMLRKRSFNNFEYVTPFNVNLESVQQKDYKELTHSCVCYDDINNIDKEEVQILTSITNYKIKTIYSGFKVVKRKEDFYKLKSINDSNVAMKNFPIFDPFREISIVLYTVSFPKNSFPIVAATSAWNKNIPLVFSQRYYNWLLTDLQTPSKNFMWSLLNLEERQTIRKKQFELFMKNFSGRPSLREVLSEYDKSNTEIQIVAD